MRLQEICCHIANDNAVGIYVAVLLEQCVESLQLNEGLGYLEVRTVIPTGEAHTVLATRFPTDSCGQCSLFQCREG